MILCGYILLLVFVVGLELTRKKTMFLDFLSVFHIFFLFSYLLVPIFFLLDESNVLAWRFLSADPSSAYSMVVFFVIALAYFSIISGFYIGQRRKIVNYVVIVPKYAEKTQLYMLLALFLFFTSMLVLYAHGHGGMLGLATSGQRIRAQLQDAGVFGYFSYFAKGIILIVIISYSFSKYAQKKKLRNCAKILFVLSLPLAIIYGLGTGGRASTGMIFVFIFFVWLNYDGVHFTLKKIILSSCMIAFILFIILFGRSMIVAFGAMNSGGSYLEAFFLHSAAYNRGKESLDIFNLSVAVLKHFDHHFASLNAIIYKPEVFQAPRFFLDWPRAFISLIPSIRMPDFVVSSMPAALNNIYFNSLDSQITGYNPVGWIGMQLINGSFIWLFFGSLISGIIGGMMNKILSNSLSLSPIIPGLLIFCCFFWKDYMIAPEATDFIFNNIPFFTFFMCFVVTFRLIIRRKAKCVA